MQKLFGFIQFKAQEPMKVDGYLMRWIIWTSDLLAYDFQRDRSAKVLISKHNYILDKPFESELYLKNPSFEAHDFLWFSWRILQYGNDNGNIRHSINKQPELQFFGIYKTFLWKYFFCIIDFSSPVDVIRLSSIDRGLHLIFFLFVVVWNVYLFNMSLFSLCVTCNNHVSCCWRWKLTIDFFSSVIWYIF